MKMVGWVAAVLLGVPGCTDPMPEDLARPGDSLTTTNCDVCEIAGVTEVDGCAPDETSLGTSRPCEGFCHVRDGITPTWDTYPPSSGDHSPVVLRALGEHTEPEPPSRWLENLERGQIVLLYDCADESCEAEHEVLASVMQARPDVVLLTPGVELPRRFAAISWTWGLETDAPNEHDLLCFVDQHVDHGRVAMP